MVESVFIVKFVCMESRRNHECRSRPSFAGTAVAVLALSFAMPFDLDSKAGNQ